MNPNLLPPKGTCFPQAWNHSRVLFYFPKLLTIQLNDAKIKIYDRRYTMAIGLSNHEVYPRVVKCGCPQTVSIVPVGEVAKFNDEWVYNIGIVPTECS